MKNSLTKNNFTNPPKVGDIVEGKIIGPGNFGFFVDLGVFGTGVVYKKELRGIKDLKKFQPGDKVFVKVIGPENEEGYFELSLGKAQEEITWQELQEKAKKGETLQVKISKANKGGLIAELPSASGFLPLSHLSSGHYPKVEGGDSTKIVQELQKLIGKTLEVKILSLDSRQKKIIFSEKAKEVQNLKEILKSCKVEDIVEGEITGVTDFGLFVKFAVPSVQTTQQPTQLEGLIHISEIEEGEAKNLSSNFAIGQKIKARIIKISEDKVYLSLKSLPEKKRG